MRATDGNAKHYSPLKRTVAVFFWKPGGFELTPRSTVSTTKSYGTQFCTRDEYASLLAPNKLEYCPPSPAHGKRLSPRLCCSDPHRGCTPRSPHRRAHYPRRQCPIAPWTSAGSGLASAAAAAAEKQVADNDSGNVEAESHVRAYWTRIFAKDSSFGENLKNFQRAYAQSRAYKKTGCTSGMVGNSRGSERQKLLGSSCGMFSGCAAVNPSRSFSRAS